MAITIEQQPNDWAAINDILVVSASSTNSGGFKFKYHFKVLINSVTIYEGLIPANEASKGMLDLSKIVREHIKADTESLSDSGFIALTNNAAKILTRSTTSIGDIGVQVGESYAASATDPVINYPNLEDISFYGVPTTKQIKDGFHSALERGLLTGTGSKFFQDTIEVDSASEKVFVTEKDRFILSFINDNSDSQVHEFEYYIYDSMDTQLSPGFVISQNASNGGNYPVLSLTIDSKLIHLKCGVVDINNSTNFGFFHKPQDNPTWAYYTIQAKNTSGAYVSKKYFFYRRDYDCRFESYQLMFKNTDGLWNFQTFGKKSIETIKSKSKKYEKVIGSWNSTNFTFNSYDRQIVDYHKTSHDELNLVSDWITEQESVIFKKALLSNEYYLLKNGGEVFPCTLINTSYKHEKRGQEKPIQLEIKVKLDPIQTP